MDKILLNEIIDNLKNNSFTSNWKIGINANGINMYYDNVLQSYQIDISSNDDDSLSIIIQDPDSEITNYKINKIDDETIDDITNLIVNNIMDNGF